jgi:lipoprotein-anchoring transpeptidase ErfK/SrfK
MAMMRMADPDAVQRYAVPPGEKFEVDAVNLSEMDPKNLRQLVDYRTTQPPGTVVFDPHKRFLYRVMENGKAVRYGVGVGKAGLKFRGTATIQDRKEWPRWTPTIHPTLKRNRRHSLAGI